MKTIKDNIPKVIHHRCKEHTKCAIQMAYKLGCTHQNKVSSSHTFQIQINGILLDCKPHDTVLKVATAAKIPIPTLCHHQYLTPDGSCRLCIVEVSHQGRTWFATACNLNVLPGMEIATENATIQSSRETIVELLLGQNPESPVISQLAKALNIEASRFKNNQKSGCILCGLCAKVCEEIVGKTALSICGKGKRKYIAPIEKSGQTLCIACGNCARICPTDAIIQTKVGAYLKKNGTLAPHNPTTDAHHCLSCDTCELICPDLAISRDRLTGKLVIDLNQCKKCGLCSEHCPKDAIQMVAPKK